jgi:very-short-patch-repair endonuclease
LKANPTTRRRAQALRRELTKAERILWSKLKGRQLAGWMFRVQHPIGPYIADFACVQLRFVVEVDGETHSSVLERQHDNRRTAFIEGEGWSILRVWNSEVYKNLEGVLRAIEDQLPPKGL